MAALYRLIPWLSLAAFGVLASAGQLSVADTDVLGDPLPKGAAARVGSIRPAEKIPEDFRQPFSLRGAALSADGKVLATYGEPANPKDGRPIHIWDGQTGKHLRELEGHESLIKAIALSPDGKTLVSTSFDEAQSTGATRIWDVATGQVLHTIPEGGEFLRFSPDGGTFWLVVRESLRVFQVKTGQEVRRFLGPNLTLDISQDGRRVLGISHKGDTVLRLYDINTNKEILKLEGTDGPPKVAKFSPDGRTIVALDSSKNVLLWEIATGRLLHQLMGHQSRPLVVVFSPDGRFLASGGLDKTVRIWELASGKEIHQHTGHTGIVTVLKFSGGSQRLVSGSTDRTALLWTTGNSLVSQLELPTLNEEAFDRFWNELSSSTPSQAYLAIGMIAAAEDETLPNLQQRLEGMLIPSKNNQIEQFLKDLENPDSLVRHRAMKELRKLRQSAQPLLIKVLEETKSAEVRARLRYILNGSNNVSRFSESDKLRMLRLIQLSENLDTPSARNLLELLAAECPLPDIVKEAQRVLTKLQAAPR